MFRAHLENWMMDQETADWIVTWEDWLNAQYEDAKNRAIAAGKTPTGEVTFVELVFQYVANDGGLIFDCIFDVAVED